MYMVQVRELAPSLTPRHPDPPKLLWKPVPCAPGQPGSCAGTPDPAPPESPGGSSRLSIASDAPLSVDQHSPASDPALQHPPGRTGSSASSSAKGTAAEATSVARPPCQRETHPRRRSCVRRTHTRPPPRRQSTTTIVNSPRRPPPHHGTYSKTSSQLYQQLPCTMSVGRFR